MYSTQIKDTTTITWHNLHFLLEHYTEEILSQVNRVITEREAYIDDERTLIEIKNEVIATVKTLKAIHTVIEHYRVVTAPGTIEHKGAQR